MIYFLPLGNNDVASSRLRVYLVASYLNAQVGVPEHYEQGDVLIIQKVHDPAELHKARIQGAKIIFDIDDYYWYRSAYEHMIEMADVVTTDTETKKAELVHINKNVVVIPDALDWDGTVAGRVAEGVVGWTGHGNNASYLNDIGKDVSRQYQWRLITSEDVGKHVDFPFTFEKWSLETVDKDLAQCEMTAYYMPDELVGNLKGMHKVLKSWAIGIPCYTSRVPDYVKAMAEAGVGEKYLVDDWSQLTNIGFDERCREYAMTYQAQEIAKQWKQIIENL